MTISHATISRSWPEKPRSFASCDRQTKATLKTRAVRMAVRKLRRYQNHRPTEHHPRKRRVHRNPPTRPARQESISPPVPTRRLEKMQAQARLSAHPVVPSQARAAAATALHTATQQDFLQALAAASRMAPAAAIHGENPI